MNIRPETTKLPEESIGDKFLDIGLGWIFVSHTESKGNKYKNKQVGLHHIKKLLHSQGNHQQNEKSTYRMGEDICKQYVQ